MLTFYPNLALIPVIWEAKARRKSLGAKSRMSRGHRSKAAACVDADRGKKHMWTLADPKRSETSSKRDVNICPPLSTCLWVWWGSFGLMAIWTHGRSTSKGTRGMSDFTQWPSAPGTPCAYRPADGLCSPIEHGVSSKGSWANETSSTPTSLAQLGPLLLK